jgi:hypothetical protein
MGLMTEEYEVGLWLNADPGDWLASLPVTSQNLDRFFFSGDQSVAADAFLHRGQASDVRAERAGVAKQALYAGLRVNLVAVGEGLGWGRERNGAGEKNPGDHGTHDEKAGRRDPAGRSG